MSVGPTSEMKLVTQVSRAYFTLDSDSSNEGEKTDITLDQSKSNKIRLPVFRSNQSLNNCSESKASKSVRKCKIGSPTATPKGESKQR